MSKYIFDIETDGLLHELTKVHVVVLKDIESCEVFSFGPGAIDGALSFLSNAELLVGHNIIRFDLKALKKVYPNFETKAVIRDTQVSAELIWPRDRLEPKDHLLAKKGKLPRNMIGRYSLAAWGHRIGEYKGDFKGPWDEWTEEMQDYCEQDVEVTFKLWHLIASKKYSEQALQLEHDVAEIIYWQEHEGVGFDADAAAKLYAELVQHRLDTETELKRVFKPWYRPGELFTPKRDNKKMGYVAGAQCQKIELVEFNPGSRDMITDRLMKLRGWKPEIWNEDGSAKVDETVLLGLPYPEVPLLLKYLLVQKRIGQLAEGKQALMKHVTRAGRIHGRVHTNGAVTGRASHSNPNLAQVPRVKHDKVKGILRGEAGEWGWEFRSLFVAPQGWRQVGVDASGLELRMLGHYMAKWDGGQYAKEVVEGDPHTLTMNAASLDSRDDAKTTIYALIYGAGDGKLGRIVKRGMKAGRAIRNKLMTNLPALGKLIDACKFKHRTVGYLKGLDGRLLHTRSEHSAPNTLLQAAGALVCKLWLVILHRTLAEKGYVRGVDYVQVLWVHDEVQLYTKPELADAIGQIAVECVTKAGEEFGLRVPLTGEFKSGQTWAECH